MPGTFSKDAALRTRLRGQLVSGCTEHGGRALSQNKLVEFWGTLLDLHVKLPTPGRAAALRDVAFMLEHGTVRITSHGGSAPSEPKKLSAEEMSKIEEWKSVYEAAVPAGEDAMRGVDASLAAQAEHNAGVITGKLDEMSADLQGVQALTARSRAAECEARHRLRACHLP
jgi:hypothetical protein